MDIRSLLNPGAVVANLKGRTRRAVVGELVDALVDAGEELDREEVVRALLEREKLGTTGIGHGIAIPHSKAGSVRRMALAVGRSRRGVSFQSVDGQPVRLVFLLVAPPQEPGPHLKALARLARILREKEVAERLIGAAGPAELLRDLIAADGGGR